jgi:hypothetical protein
MPTLTHDQISRMFPSIGKQIEESRVIVKNSMPKALAKNAIKPIQSTISGTPKPGIGYTEIQPQKQPEIPAAAVQMGIQGVFAEISKAWMAKERAEKTVITDPMVHVQNAFAPAFRAQQAAKAKTSNSAATKKGDDLQASISNRWQNG